MVSIYADCANLEQMEQYRDDTRIAGFTTNPSLMKKAGVTDYQAFARDVLSIAGGRPVSFEVLSEDVTTMVGEAGVICSWGKNVYAKVPIGVDLERFWGLRLNVTALMTIKQIEYVAEAVADDNIVSIFAGRIADTGRDPVKTMRYAVNLCPHLKVLWASAREVLSFYQADEIGCDIITLAPDLIAKLPMQGKSLEKYSKETVQQFFNDGKGITF